MRQAKLKEDDAQKPTRRKIKELREMHASELRHNRHIDSARCLQGALCKCAGSKASCMVHTGVLNEPTRGCMYCAIQTHAWCWMVGNKLNEPTSSLQILFESD